ncbi:uncharacterized protein LOC124140287 [Haliotis rufescens]|uniref:uncharacterized protein LOC124140287 n=1 Tax=Haliotis rufescens TaxID=6454 RepID=UPI00201F7326|nr:uncharacterized protein LOC124140287 [Haliotis rufescens]
MVPAMRSTKTLLLMSCFTYHCGATCTWPFLGNLTVNDAKSPQVVMNCLRKCLQRSCTSVSVTSSGCKMAATSNPLELGIARVPSRLAGACQDHPCAPGTTCEPHPNGAYQCTKRKDTPRCSNNFHKTPKCKFPDQVNIRTVPKVNLNVCGDLCVNHTQFLCGGFVYATRYLLCRLFPHHKNLLDLSCTKNIIYDSYRRDCYFV